MNKKNEAVLYVKISYDPNELPKCRTETKIEGDCGDILNCLSVAARELSRSGVPAEYLFTALTHGLEKAHKED